MLLAKRRKFNAEQGLDSTRLGNDITAYGLNWSGPPPLQLLVLGQLAAAELFVVVAGLPEDGSGSM